MLIKTIFSVDFFVDSSRFAFYYHPRPMKSGNVFPEPNAVPQTLRGFKICNSVPVELNVNVNDN